MGVDYVLRPGQGNYSGPPHIKTIGAVYAHTMKDSRDQVYYRVSTWEPWKRLSEERHYRELNQVIEKYRKGKL